MNTSIAEFFAKATGPLRFRSELRQKTKPLSTLLWALDTMGTVGTELPKSVLGGDIFALMSGRLRQLLQYSEQPERVMYAVPAKRSRFTAGPDVSACSEKTKFFLSSLAAKESPNQFDLWKSVFQNQDRVSSLPISNNIVTETDQFAPPQVPEEAQPAREPETVVHHSTQPSIPWKDNITKEHIQKRGTGTSILVERIEEYWKLSQRKQATEQGSSHSNNTIAEEGRPTASLSVWSPRALSHRLWPEMTGRHIAQQIHELASGRGGTDSSKIHFNLPEKVEIQNVFNIEVRPEGNKGTGSMNDLAEKITDILREQALQHGIDIT